MNMYRFANIIILMSTRARDLVGGDARLEQQKQLEHGLKSVSSKDPKRWELIAEHVDGKSKKQCVARYKELVQRMKEKK